MGVKRQQPLCSGQECISDTHRPQALYQCVGFIDEQPAAALIHRNPEQILSGPLRLASQLASELTGWLADQHTVSLHRSGRC